MRQRGRKSGASLQVVRLPSASRQPPPADLSPAEQSQWVSIVNSMPADWFSAGNVTLLKSLVRHHAEADRISGMLQLLDDTLTDAAHQGRNELDLVFESVETREQLLRMRERETRAATALARSMRLTQQAAYDKTKAVQRRTGPSPWERFPHEGSPHKGLPHDRNDRNHDERDGD